MLKKIITLLFLPILLVGMDGLRQRRIGTAQETRRDLFLEEKEIEAPMQHPINMLKLVGSTALFICGFSHLLHRIEAGTLACDPKLLAELVSTCFFVPMADEYGNLMEQAAGN